MESKTLGILFGILCVLVGIMFFVPAEKPQTNMPEKTSFNLNSIKVESISKITLEGKGKSTNLIKNKEDWIVESLNYAANNEKVTAYLNLFNSSSIDGPISTNPEKHSRFDLDESKGISLSLYNIDNEVMANLVFGKQGNDWLSTYVKKKDGKEVYTISTPFWSQSNPDPSFWIDTQLFDFSSDSVSSITVQNTTHKAELSDISEKHVSFATELSNLVFSKIETNVPENLGEPIYKVDVSLPEKQITSKIWPLDSNNLLVKKSDSDLYFSMPVTSTLSIDSVLKQFGS